MLSALKPTIVLLTLLIVTANAESEAAASGVTMLAQQYPPPQQYPPSQQYPPPPPYPPQAEYTPPRPRRHPPTQDLTSATERRQVVQELATAADYDGRTETYTIAGQKQEIVLVTDSGFHHGESLSKYLISGRSRELARIGFERVAVTDSPSGNVWTSLICPDHFGPLEPYNTRDGTIMVPKQPKVHLGVAVKETCGGLLVSSVMPESPAERADVRAGDKILSIDGERVTGMSSLFEILATKSEADSAKI